MTETVITYVQTFSSISEALNRIGSAASIQSRRVKRLEDKGIRWVTFYTGTRQASIDASRYVGTANDDLEKSYREVETLFQKIKPIGELLAAKRKELRDYIFQLGADAAAVMFVGAAAALAVVSGPAVAFKAASIQKEDSSCQK
jgi:DNA-binding Lrp family transcriptional regulator